MAIVKRYEDGSFLEYGIGNFDEWCVYYTDSSGKRSAPWDKDYFEELYNFSQEYGEEKVYSDFIKIYDRTNKEVEEEVLTYIEEVSRSYEPNDRLRVDKLFTTLYMAMISEENRKNTRLGKRIKRLGIHALLIEHESIEKSTKFMNNKRWIEIDEMCRERGF